MKNTTIELIDITNAGLEKQLYDVTIFSGMTTYHMSRIMSDKTPPKTLAELGFKLKSITETVQHYLTQGSNVITTYDDAGVILGSLGVLNGHDTGTLTVLAPEGEGGILKETVKDYPRVKWVTTSKIQTISDRDYENVKGVDKLNRKEISDELSELRIELEERVKAGKPTKQIKNKMAGLRKKRKEMGKLYSSREMEAVLLRRLAVKISRNLIILTLDFELDLGNKYASIEALNNGFPSTLYNFTAKPSENPVYNDFTNIPEISRVIRNTSEDKVNKFLTNKFNLNLETFKDLITQSEYIGGVEEVEFDLSLNEEITLASRSDSNFFEPSRVILGKTVFNLEELSKDEYIVLIDSIPEPKDNTIEEDEEQEKQMRMIAFGETSAEESVESRIRAFLSRNYIIATYLDLEKNETNLPTEKMLEILEENELYRGIVFLSNVKENELFDKLINNNQIMIINPELFGSLSLGTSSNSEGKEVNNVLSKKRMEEFVISSVCDFMTYVSEDKKFNRRLMNFFSLRNKPVTIHQKSGKSNVYSTVKYNMTSDRLREQPEISSTGGFSLSKVFDMSTEIISDDMIKSKLKIDELTEKL